MIIDSNFEDKVLACTMKLTEFCASTTSHLKADYFGNPVKHNIAKVSIDFYKKYQSRLSNIGFVEAVKGLVRAKIISEKDVEFYVVEYKRLKALNVDDWKFIQEQLINFIKNKEVKRLIEESVKTFLPKNNFEAIEKGMRNIAAITLNGSVKPYDYFSVGAIESRTLKREEDARHKRYGISTGIKRMDDLFPHKGWYHKELYTILAPPKRGKTMALQWFANAACLQGFNVVIFTLETSTEIYSDRMDAMNANIEIKRLPENIRTAAEHLKGMDIKGSMLIYEYPTKRLSPDGVEAHLRQLELDGFETDILFVDYADIMKPCRTYNDRLQEDESIYEDLRGLASVFDIPVVTASQVNRAGSDRAIITGRDTAGTFGKIMVSDAIITLPASDAEMKRGEMKIHFAECRNMAKATLKIKTAYNFGKFYKEFVEEVEMAT